MIEESTELRAIALRWVKAIDDLDGRTQANLYSRSEAVRYIGTDPDEWWSGRDVGTVAGRHLEEFELTGVGLDIEVAEVEAFEHGPVGWASVRTSISFGDQSPIPIRMTLVFVLEDGVWKIVQSHNSVAVQNPDVLGVQITTGLAELLAALGDDTEGEIRAAVPEGTVTLMFTDIEDSASLASQLGDGAWAETVGWHDDLVRRVVEAHGGVVVKTLGDGAMAVFESTRLAARAATAFQQAISGAEGRAQIRVRIGLHVGDVVHTGGDFLGHAVNKAARIASAAAGGQIMVSNVVNAMLADTPEFEFGEPFDTELKGLPGVHEVVPLLWDSGRLRLVAASDR